MPGMSILSDIIYYSKTIPLKAAWKYYSIFMSAIQLYYLFVCIKQKSSNFVDYAIYFVRLLLFCVKN